MADCGGCLLLCSPQVRAMGSMVTEERKATEHLSVGRKYSWMDIFVPLPTSCLPALFKVGTFWGRGCCLSYAWVSPRIVRGSFLIAPGHRWDLKAPKFHCCFLFFFFKVFDENGRILKGTVQFSAHIRPAVWNDWKNKRILFQMLRLFYDMVKELFLSGRVTKCWNKLSWEMRSLNQDLIPE